MKIKIQLIGSHIAPDEFNAGDQLPYKVVERSDKKTSFEWMHDQGRLIENYFSSINKIS